jgi:hypothetical protein
MFDDELGEVLIVIIDVVESINICTYVSLQRPTVLGLQQNP